MRWALFFSVAFGTVVGPCQAQLLAHDAIIDSLEGRWAITYEDNPDTELGFRCDGKALQIWFTQSEGELTYNSQREGSDFINTSRVMLTPQSDGSYFPWILLQYENETRMTDAGAPVRWRLIMTDRDTFYWGRADWDWGNFTTARRRCKNGDAGA